MTNFCLWQELSKEFQRQEPPLVLAVALSGYKEVIDQAYDLAAIGRYVEFMSVMSYDYHGAWERVLGHVSPLYYRSGDHFPQYNTVCLQSLPSVQHSMFVHTVQFHSVPWHTLCTYKSTL